MHPVVKINCAALLVPALAAVGVLAASCGTAASSGVRPIATPVAVASGVPQARRLPFGATFHAPGGVDVTLSEPVPYAPSTDALADGSQRYVRFRLTLVNHSGSALAPAAVVVKAWAGGRQRRAVVDGAKHVGRAKRWPIPDGATRSAVVAFGMPKGPAVLTVRVDPSGGLDPSADVRFAGPA